MRNRITMLQTMITMSFVAIQSILAVDVPQIVPDNTDGTGNMDKPVKVYILAGQSNMVGFGTIKGSKPVYPSIYLSADPKIKIGRMPAGPSALLSHGIYQTAEEGSDAGAKTEIYTGSYDADRDYAVLTPAKESTVALGAVKAELPSIEGPSTTIAKGFIDVPMTGTYEVHVGFDESTHAIASVDGQEVYRKEKDEAATLTQIKLEEGKRYPLEITYLKTGSAALWLKLTDLEGKGDLQTITKAGKFPWFVDEDGEWTVRNDVTYWDVRLSKKELGDGGPLTVTSNGGTFIGPEVPFGYVMGAYHDEHVLLIESSIGNRSISWDFRPPSSGRAAPDNTYEGYEYRHMVEGVQKTLANLDKVIPGYKGQGYDIAGFVWWQGHKDSGQTKEQYEEHLVNLIQDLRKDVNAPDMRVAVATVGFHGFNLPESWQGVWEAQMAVGDPEQHPEFSKTVTSVDTRPFWRSTGNSPAGVDYHYNKNAEIYALTGDALGRAMARMMGGEAEDIVLPPEPQRHPDVEKIFSDEVTSQFNKNGTHYPPAYYREMGQALKPIIFEEMIPAFLDVAFNPKSPKSLKHIVGGEKPDNMPLDIRSPLDELIRLYEVGGMNEYGWKPFVPTMRDATWYYYSFDPPEKQPLEQSDRYRDITYPEGMGNWHTVDFDPEIAGWQKGQAPFGQLDGKLMPLRPSCDTPYCGCSMPPATLWEHEVLLMRQTFELPPLKDDHVYRLILGGAGCDRTGEGFAIYANGKQLTQQNGGFFRHHGVRGAYVFSDTLPEFENGKVTIAIINFLRYTHFKNNQTYWGPLAEYKGKTVPPNGHVTLWMEEAELPKEVLQKRDK